MKTQTGLCSFHGDRRGNLNAVEIDTCGRQGILFRHHALCSATCFDWGISASIRDCNMLADALLMEVLDVWPHWVRADDIKELVSDFAFMLGTLPDEWSILDSQICSWAAKWLSERASNLRGR